jgi:hypothetical protein
VIPLPLPLDPDLDLQAAAFIAAGPQRLTCGHDIEKGETLVELTTKEQHYGTCCSVCYQAVGHRVVTTSGIW